MTGNANNYDVTTAVSVFEEAGIALNKVILGAPAYTRAWGGVRMVAPLVISNLARVLRRKGRLKLGFMNTKTSCLM